MSLTPILDRQKPLPPQHRPRRVASLAIGGVLGLLLVLFPVIGPQLDNSPPFIVVFLAAFFLGIFAHETGHLVAGLAVNFEFRRMHVGPLMVTRTRNGYRLRFIYNRLIAGGHVFMVPRTPSDLSRRFAIFTAGGPAVTTLCFLPIAFLPWSSFGAPAFAANFFLLACCCIPFESRGQNSDAKVIRLLMDTGTGGRRLAAALYIMALDGSGIRPAEWPREAVDDLATRDDHRVFRATARSLAYLYVRETAPTDDAGEALERVLEIAGELNPEQRRSYLSEASFWQGTNNRNVELARAWLSEARAVKAGVPQKGWESFALSAIAFAQGNRAEFRLQLGKALAYLDRMPGPSGGVEAARARLKQLAEREAAIAATA